MSPDYDILQEKFNKLQCEATRLREENEIFKRMDKLRDPDEFFSVEIWFRRTVNELRSEINRLREALSWAVGFIKCQLPKTSQQYPDMRNAEDLLEGNAVLHGEFSMTRIKAELQSEAIKRVIPCITELLAFRRNYFNCFHEEGCHACDGTRKIETLKKELEELT